MCVIIIRPPNTIIPPTLIDNACHVNPDGYGISTLKDNGKFEQIKHYSKDGNNSKEITKIMDEFNTQWQFLHLRFATRGEKNTTNLHPFHVYNKDEYQMFFMHNGTISSVDNFAFSKDTNKFSDSTLFAQNIVKPLIHKYYSNVAKDNPLKDNTFKAIMNTYAGHNNKFLFYDNKQNTFMTNESNWFDFKDDKGNKWFASNKYSFDRTHREPSTTTYYYGKGVYTPKNQSTTTDNTKTTTPTSITTAPKSGMYTKEERKDAASFINHEYFWLNTEENPEDAYYLKTDEIEDLVENIPTMAVEIIENLSEKYMLLYDMIKEDITDGHTVPSARLQEFVKNQENA